MGGNGVHSVNTYNRSSNDLTIETDVTVPDCSTGARTASIGYGSFSVLSGTDYVSTYNNGTIQLFYINGGVITESPTYSFTCTNNVSFHLKLVVLHGGGAQLYVNDSSSPNVSVSGGTFTTQPVFLQSYAGSAIYNNFSLSNTAASSDVSSVQTTAGNAQNVISWTNPNDAGFTGAMIRYRTDTYPTSASDGTLVIDKSGSPGAQDSYTHLTLTNGQTYYYKLFAHDITPNYAAGVTTSGTPTVPVPTVNITTPTTSLTVHDETYDFSIPWIQTSTTLAVTATGTNIASGGGLEFILDTGTASETSIKDLSAPYSASFTNVKKGNHTIDVYALDSDGTSRINNSGGHQQLTNIGVGDIIAIIGDSTSAGYSGNSTSGNVTTCALSDHKTADCRTFDQHDSGGYGVFSSYAIQLATDMESYLGYPVFIMNEGWSSTNAYFFLNTINAQSQFQNRMLALMPNRWLINYGVNDVRCDAGLITNLCSPTSNATTYQQYLQSIIDTLKSSYGASNDQIYIAKKFSRDTEAGVQSLVPSYWTAISTVLGNNAGLHTGPNLWDYFLNHVGDNISNDGLHPNAAGYLQVARLWEIDMMQPQNVSVSQNAGTVTLNWSSLSSTEPTISGYKVKYGTTSGTYSTIVDVGNTTTKIISGLTSGQTYYFVVSAYDNDATLINETQNSSEISITYDSTAPVLYSKTTFSGWYNSNQTSTFTYTDSGSGIVSGTPVTCNITTEGSAQTCSITPNVCDASGNCNTTLVTSNGANIDKTASTISAANTTSYTSSVCTDSAPISTPDLFQITTTSDTATVFFTPVANITKYHFSYATDPSAEEYGAEVTLGSNGIQSYMIKSLASGTTYYFKVRGQNGCMPGGWSTVKSATTTGGTSFIASLLPQKPAMKITDLTVENPNPKPKQCSYTVKPEDNLWNIASEVYGSGAMYHKIIDYNKDKYPNIANTLTVGWKLSFPCEVPKEDTGVRTNPQTHDVLIKIMNEGKPLVGANVELHSNPKYGKTNEKGEVLFANVEKGEHTLLISYKNYNAKQKLNVDGDNKDFNISVNVELKDGGFTTQSIAIIAGLVGIIFVLLFIIIRIRRAKARI